MLTGRALAACATACLAVAFTPGPTVRLGNAVRRPRTEAEEDLCPRCRAAWEPPVPMARRAPWRMAVTTVASMDRARQMTKRTRSNTIAKELVLRRPGPPLHTPSTIDPAPAPASRSGGGGGAGNGFGGSSSGNGGGAGAGGSGLGFGVGVAAGSGVTRRGGPAPTDPLRWYLRRMTRIELLKPREEVLLAQQIQKGVAFARLRTELTGRLGRAPTQEEWAAALEVEPDALRVQLRKASRARAAMISANLRLVVSMAKRYRNVGLTYLDLIQEGSIGLMKAAERFDPDKGFKFSTYATWWVKQSMMRAIADHSRTIRLPVHVHEFLTTARRSAARLEQELGRPPSDAEVARALGVTPDKLEFYRRASRAVASIDSSKSVTRRGSGASEGSSVVGPGGGGGGGGGGPTQSFSGTTGGGKGSVTISDMMREPGPSPEDTTQVVMLREDVGKLLQTLSPREQEVVRLRFGLDGGKAHTLEEIGQVFSVTRERVRQIEARALQKLRQPYRNHKLREHALEVAHS